MPEKETGAGEPVEAAPATQSAEAERKTPEQWAKELGHFIAGDRRLPQSEPHYDIPHAAANTLYGWSEHAYHFQDRPFMLTMADYEAALKAAMEYPVVAPHAAAITPRFVQRFQGFVPRARREEKA